MLHRRDRATGTSNRDTDATSRDLDGVRGPDGDDGDEHVGAAAEVEPEVYDDGDWDEDEDGAAADWEEGEEQGDWDNTDEDDEEFVPPTAGTALRRSWLSAQSRTAGYRDGGRRAQGQLHRQARAPHRLLPRCDAHRLGCRVIRR